jgi:hypothetical protein
MKGCACAAPMIKLAERGVNQSSKMYSSDIFVTV